MNATREKKIAFIQSFGQRTMQQCMASMISDRGSNILTDEQIDIMAERLVEEARDAIHRNIANRKQSAVTSIDAALGNGESA